MKRNDLYSMRISLQKIQAMNLSGAKFIYAVSANLRTIESELKHMEKAIEPSEAFEHYRLELKKTVEKFAKKDDKGEFILKDSIDQFGNAIKIYDVKGVENTDSEYNKAIKEVEEKHNVVVKNQLEKEESFSIFLSEEIDENEIRIRKIKPDHIPDSMKQNQLDQIWWMIDHD